MVYTYNRAVQAGFQAAELIDASDVNGIEALNILGILLSFFVEQMAKRTSSEQTLEELEINVALFLTQKVSRVLVERSLQLEGKLTPNS